VAYLNGSKVLTTGSALVFDGSNLGLGVTPVVNASYKGIQLVDLTSTGIYGSGYGTNITTNAYLTGVTTYTRGGNSYRPSKFSSFDGAFTWSTAAAAGTTITWTDAMTLDASGNLLVGTTSNGGGAKLKAKVAAGTFGLEVTDESQSDFVVAPLSGAVCRVGPSSGAMAFYSANTERARINTSGNLLVGTTNINPAGSGVTGVVIGPTGGILQSSGSGASYFAVTSTSGTHIQFYTYNAGAVAAGLISSNGSTTSYTGASDYRLKENIAPMTGALAKVAQLNPVTYKWKLDGSDGQGFIAHELQTIFPDAVVGEKDAVNEDGSIKPQGVDTSFLVATLTAAIQEQQALITQLNARITALESA
jgi:hypothetical protein